MPDYFLVEHVRGPAWDPGRGRRDQAGWDEHASFMDQLADEGIVLLGGPVGDVNGEKSVLVPSSLVPPSAPRVPRRAAHMLDEEVIGHNKPSLRTQGFSAYG